MPATATQRARTVSSAGLGSAEGGARQLKRHPAFRRVARAGMVARAVIYVMLGGLTVEIAVRGRPSAQADSQGALADIARQPAGPELLGFLGAGLAAYALWRFIQAAAGTGDDGVTELWRRLGWALIGCVYVFLCENVVTMLAAGRMKSGPSQHPASVAATVLGWPAGAEWLGLLATAVAAGGVALVVWAVVHDDAGTLESSAPPRAARAVRVTGTVGDAARGVAVLLVAASLFDSALSGDPLRAKSLDAALQSLAGGPAGPPLLVLIGLGLASYAAFSMLEARWRQV